MAPTYAVPGLFFKRSEYIGGVPIFNFWIFTLQQSSSEYTELVLTVLLCLVLSLRGLEAEVREFEDTTQERFF